MEMKRYYILGTSVYPYLVKANSEQEALDKCIEYEQTMYDSWASCEEPYDWPYYYNFKIISKEDFLNYNFYKDLVNYDFEKNCYWSSNNFCDTVKIDKSKFECTM